MNKINPTVSYINAIMAEMGRERKASAKNMRLGKLIEILSNLPADKPIVTDTGHPPGQFMSYRGYYEDLAFDAGEEPCTVGEFLERARLARGKVFTGYKGGDFPMHDESLLWFSSYGCCSGDGPVGVREEDERVVILIEQCEQD